MLQKKSSLETHARYYDEQNPLVGFALANNVLDYEVLHVHQKL